MAADPAIDPELVKEASQTGELCTQQETVNQAPQAIVQRQKQLEVTALFGNFPPDEDYDYKQGRQQAAY